MHIEKEKLPKGFTYPLKSSLFKCATDKAEITTYMSLNYSINSILFEAYYWLPNSIVDYDRFYIRTGAVESPDSKKAREYLDRYVIPDFIVWSREILNLPSNSPRFNEQLHFSMDH